MSVTQEQRGGGPTSRSSRSTTLFFFSSLNIQRVVAVSSTTYAGVVRVIIRADAIAATLAKYDTRTSPSLAGTRDLGPLHRQSQSLLPRSLSSLLCLSGHLPIPIVSATMFACGSFLQLPRIVDLLSPRYKTKHIISTSSKLSLRRLSSSSHSH